MPRANTSKAGSIVEFFRTSPMEIALLVMGMAKDAINARQAQVNKIREGQKKGKKKPGPKPGPKPAAPAPAAPAAEPLTPAKAKKKKPGPPKGTKASKARHTPPPPLEDSDALPLGDAADLTEGSELPPEGLEPDPTDPTDQ